MVTISSIDLAASREPMRWRPNSDAPVDCDAGAYRGHVP
jgi:hypothetical protein